MKKTYKETATENVATKADIACLEARVAQLEVSIAQGETKLPSRFFISIVGATIVKIFIAIRPIISNYINAVICGAIVAIILSNKKTRKSHKRGD